MSENAEERNMRSRSRSRSRSRTSEAEIRQKSEEIKKLKLEMENMKMQHDKEISDLKELQQQEEKKHLSSIAKFARKLGQNAEEKSGRNLALVQLQAKNQFVNSVISEYQTAFAETLASLLVDV